MFGTARSGRSTVRKCLPLAAIATVRIALQFCPERSPPFSKGLHQTSMMHFRTLPKLIRSLAAAVTLLGYASLLQAQIQPANPSFSNPVNSDFLGPPTTQFGTFRQGNPGATLNFNVYNLPASTGTTSSMSLDHAPQSVGDDVAIFLQTAGISGLQPVGAGGTPNAPMQLILTTSQVGNLQVSYTLEFKSDSVTTPNQSIAIAAYATVLRHGDYNADGKVDGGDYVVWRKTRGQGVSPPYSRADDNGDGQVTDADYIAWRSAFTGSFGSGSSNLSGPLGVPEPTTAILGLVGALFAALTTTRMRNRA